MKYTEAKDGKAPELEIITENLAAITAMIQTQNDILLVLANKLNVETDMPDCKTKEEFEKSVGPKIQACINAIRGIYGPGETDKS